MFNIWYVGPHNISSILYDLKVVEKTFHKFRMLKVELIVYAALGSFLNHGNDINVMSS